MMQKFQKHIGLWEKIVAIILYLMLFLTVVTQLFFSGDVLLLMLVVGGCTAVFSWLVFYPETYEIHEDCLVVCRGERCIEIQYASITSIDTLGSFRGLKRDFDSVEVVLKYKLDEKGRVRSVVCHPRNVLGFVKLLREKCQNLDVELD